jgi:pimeloyl-ACP methyl ester carboxylesterase
MPVVLVHGVPETPSIWDPLVARLGRDDVITPQLPGFGCARPDGFGATKEDYVAWLIAELEATPGPIDLVGHDWGGGLTVRLVSTRADLVRSWVTDAAGLADIDFEWHEFAKIWQTPGAGEAFFAQNLAIDPSERGGVFETFGVPKDQLHRLTHLDETMADCILALYRSAVDVGKEWSSDFANVPKPGLVMIASDDPFLAEARAANAASRAGATIARVEGIGHWWMLQDPARSAALLADFWATL